MNPNSIDEFPLSKNKKIKGTRRLAREKAMQVIVAAEISDIDWAEMFNHIFFRDFNFGDDEEKIEKLLKPAEVLEMESDTPIEWKQDQLDFARLLIYETNENRDELDRMIDEFAKNWELERIAIIDRALMQMAATELLKFKEIPAKVSINEAIEIAKLYSTDNSGHFINGVLDAMLADLKAKDKIKKSGRGLL